MNKHFTIYNSSGEILRFGTCPVSSFEAQKQAGEFILEGTPTNNVMIKDGKFVSKPEASNAQKIAETQNQIRVERNGRLMASDWSQLPDVTLSDSKKTEFQTYRQKLRDLPSVNKTKTSIDQVEFPKYPEV